MAAAPIRLLDATHGAPDPDRRQLERAVRGRFRIDRLLSAGGMGAVYLAWEHGLERQVALKTLASGERRDGDDRGRFRREARILAGLLHPHIAPVYAFGETEHLAWYAMPYYAGGTLADRLARDGRLSFGDARRILAELADALDAAHRAGIVHKDLKPGNVLFDGWQRAVLTDFGVATVRTSDHSRAEAGRGFGTPEYMSPEQLGREHDSDGRSDLYGLGVLGFQMVTGRLPFAGTAEEVAAQHLARPAPRVAAYRAGVPDDLGRALDRCLEKDPRRRWPTAAALRDALRAGPARRGVLDRLRAVAAGLVV
jgi:serine/threonine-protein kinase